MKRAKINKRPPKWASILEADPLYPFKGKPVAPPEPEEEEPEPPPPTTTERSTWGKVKQRYR